MENAKNFDPDSKAYNDGYSDGLRDSYNIGEQAGYVQGWEDAVLAGMSDADEGQGLTSFRDRVSSNLDLATIINNDMWCELPDGSMSSTEYVLSNSGVIENKLQGRLLKVLFIITSKAKDLDELLEEIKSGTASEKGWIPLTDLLYRDISGDEHSCYEDVLDELKEFMDRSVVYKKHVLHKATQTSMEVYRINFFGIMKLIEDQFELENLCAAPEELFEYFID